MTTTGVARMYPVEAAYHGLQHALDRPRRRGVIVGLPAGMAGVALRAVEQHLPMRRWLGVGATPCRVCAYGVRPWRRRRRVGPSQPGGPISWGGPAVGGFTPGPVNIVVHDPGPNHAQHLAQQVAEELLARRNRLA